MQRQVRRYNSNSRRQESQPDCSCSVVCSRNCVLLFPLRSTRARGASLFPFAASRGRATNSWLEWIHRNFHRRRRRSVGVGVGVRTYSPHCPAPLCPSLGVRHNAPFSHSPLDPSPDSRRENHSSAFRVSSDGRIAGKRAALERARAGRRAVAVCRLKRNAYSLWRRTRTPTDKSANEALRSAHTDGDLIQDATKSVNGRSVKRQCNIAESRIITRPSSRLQLQCGTYRWWPNRSLE